MAYPVDNNAFQFNQNIGAIIRQKRLLMGLSQKNVAKKIGVSFQQVQKYESGQTGISVYKFKQICGAMQISFDNIFTATKYPDIYDEESFDLLNKFQSMDPNARKDLAKIIARL